MIKGKNVRNQGKRGDQSGVNNVRVGGEVREVAGAVMCRTY